MAFSMDSLTAMLARSAAAQQAATQQATAQQVAPQQAAAQQAAAQWSTGQQPAAAESISAVPPPSSAFQSVYSSVAPPYADAHALGPARVPEQASVLPADLPPQALLTSAMLLEFIDKKIIVVLRGDDKTFVGVLRSYDQYGNLVLTDSFERFYASNPRYESNDPTKPRFLVCDVPTGPVCVRGENVAIAGEVDLLNEDELPNCEFAPVSVVKPIYSEQRKIDKEQTARRLAGARKLGFEGPAAVADM